MRRNINITFLFLVVILAFNSFRSGAFSDPMAWIMSELMMLPGIIIGLAFHEYAHAKVAYRLGDPTPKFQGRVTVNPLAHIDPLGLAALLFAGFGWGVPVEINPANFRNRRRDELLVALAGVTMNLIVAVAFAVIAKLLFMFAFPFITGSVGSILWTMIMYVIQINLVLMIFNLIPCPPLDGFTVVSELFDIKHTDLYWTIYRYGDMILIFIILFGITGRIISPCVNFMFGILQNFIM